MADAAWRVAVVALPMRTRFRGLEVRETALVRGPGGWGEFCPFVEYDDAEAAAWWRCARESADGGWPAPVRDEVEVNVTVPAVDPARAHAIVAGSGARTAKVKVAERGRRPEEDLARVEAVRDALGPRGLVRVDANGAWDVEQPVASVDDLARVRRRVDVPIAADESIRRADDPLRVARAGAADVAVLKVAPLGGVVASLRIAEEIGLPCVVSSAIESSVGLAAGLALAGALPELPHACGLGTASLLAEDVVGDPLVPRGGRLRVPRAAPAPDDDLLARHAAPEERRDWWTARLERVVRGADVDDAVDRP